MAHLSRWYGKPLNARWVSTRSNCDWYRGLIKGGYAYSILAFSNKTMVVWPRLVGSAYESSNRRDNSSPDSSNCDRKVFIYLVARYLTFRWTFFSNISWAYMEEGKHRVRASFGSSCNISRWSGTSRFIIILCCLIHIRVCWDKYIDISTLVWIALNFSG